METNELMLYAVIAITIALAAVLSYTLITQKPVDEADKTAKFLSSCDDFYLGQLRNVEKDRVSVAGQNIVFVSSTQTNFAPLQCCFYTVVDQNDTSFVDLNTLLRLQAKYKYGQCRAQD